MNDYSYPISTAALHFALAALVLTVPFILVQYIRYGSVSKWRAVILCSFFFYLLCAYYLVILPLPSPEQSSGWVTPTMQLVPFRFVGDIISQTPLVISDYRSYLPALTQSSVLEPLFNLLMTLPFGVYLQYYFKFSFRRTLLLSFLLTLFFELTQLSGLYGIYPHPYRLFDVDDLIINTLGGILGWLCARRVLGFLPTREQIDRKNVEKSSRVGYTRRLFALLIDAFIASILTLIAGLLLGKDRLSLLPYISTSLLMLYFLVLHAVFGKTLGKALVHLRIERITPKDGDGSKRPPFWLLLLRYSLLCAAALVYQLLGYLVVTSEANGIYAAVQVAILALVVLDFIRSLFFGKMLVYELISGLHNVNTKT
jgi:glycopeptide antibiotics resistance protein